MLNFMSHQDLELIADLLNRRAQALLDLKDRCTTPAVVGQLEADFKKVDQCRANLALLRAYQGEG